MEPNIFGLDFNEDNTNYLYLMGGFIVVIIFLCYFFMDNKNNPYTDKISIKKRNFRYFIAYIGYCL